MENNNIEDLKKAPSERSLYLKVESSDKNRILNFIGEIIEKPVLHRIYAQKLENGDYSVEVIESSDEPPIL